MKLKVKGMNKSAGVQKREAQEKEKWAGWASIGWITRFRNGAGAPA
jgi:hypothetical protein